MGKMFRAILSWIISLFEGLHAGQKTSYYQKFGNYKNYQAIISNRPKNESEWHRNYRRRRRKLNKISNLSRAINREK
jgi:hypothetical protein